MLISLIEVFRGYPLYFSLTSDSPVCFPVEASEYSKKLEYGLGAWFLRAVVHVEAGYNVLIPNRPPLLHMGLLGSVAGSTMLAGACPPSWCSLRQAFCASGFLPLRKR